MVPLRPKTCLELAPASWLIQDADSHSLRHQPARPNTQTPPARTRPRPAVRGETAAGQCSWLGAFEGHHQTPRPHLARAGPTCHPHVRLRPLLDAVPQPLTHPEGDVELRGRSASTTGWVTGKCDVWRRPTPPMRTYADSNGELEAPTPLAQRGRCVNPSTSAMLPAPPPNWRAPQHLVPLGESCRRRPHRAGHPHRPCHRSATAKPTPAPSPSWKPSSTTNSALTACSPRSSARSPPA